ncbi:hypothetical protein NDU88_001318 [Pleurodeles waltl]|uniref:Uncharacterized protein n=1 Tax=Pleurodeles waltl TaxID=8319 RepID=A0AAV7MKN1_PLEWA|nr:hypothetical protein NDU88_001318 [Pleurodeles waltl]
MMRNPMMKGRVGFPGSASSPVPLLDARCRGPCLPGFPCSRAPGSGVQRSISGGAGKPGRRRRGPKKLLGALFEVPLGAFSSGFASEQRKRKQDRR